MRFRFVVECEVRRERGKFPSRDDVEAELQATLEQADPCSMTVGEDSELEVDDWTVTNASDELERERRAPQELA